MLLGQHIRLRPVEREDLPRFVKWFADPDVRFNLAAYRPFSTEQEEAWYARNQQAGDLQTWAIDAPPVDVMLGHWVHIGSCGFHEIDWRNRAGEVGIVIGARDFWDRGYGTDAMRTLVQWGFETLNLHRIQLRVYSTNPRAQRCYEKVGFTLEGRLREDNYRQGTYRDSLLMSILRREWGAREDSGAAVVAEAPAIE